MFKMPTIILGFFLVFLLAPIWSFTFVRNPIDLVSYAPLTGSLHILAFFVFPVLICVSILMRHISLVSIFTMEVLTIITLTLLSKTSPAITWLQVSLVAITFMIAVFAFDRDLVAPFLERSTRSWRKHKRIPTSAPGTAIVDGVKIAVTIVDVSYSGLGFSLPLDQADAVTQSGQRVEIAPESGEPFPLAVTWINKTGPSTIVGLRALESLPMQQLFHKLNGTEGEPGALDRLWANTFLRRAMLTVCFVSLVLAFGIRATIPVG